MRGKSLQLGGKNNNMQHGKTIELNNIPGPIAREIKDYRNDGSPIYGKSYFLFRANRPATQNTFQGLVHLQTLSEYMNDVRQGNMMPNPSAYRKNKISRRLSKLARKMRKFNLIHQ